MIDLMYVTPPKVQTGHLLSARVAGIWADDAVWLDGMSRQPRMVRETVTGDWQDTNGAEKTMRCGGKEVIFNILHRYDMLHWKVTFDVDGSGSSTIRIYYRNKVAMTQTRTGGGTWTFEGSASLSGLGVTLATWCLARVRVTLQTASGTNARVTVHYIEERSAGPGTSYVTPDTYADESVPSATSLNKIPNCIAGLDAILYWPNQGMGRAGSEGWEEPSTYTTIKAWRTFHHGDTLYYRVWAYKDTSDLSRQVAWRLKYAGTVVAQDAYAGVWTGDEGKEFTGSADVSALANQNDWVEAELQWCVTGGTEGKGRVEIDYLFTRAETGISVPGRIQPTAYVYGNTPGQTATLDRIATLLKEIADDDGTGWNANGRARLYPRSVAVPNVTRKRIYLVHWGWPTLRYRAFGDEKGAGITLHWGDDQVLTLKPPIKGDVRRSRVVDLRALTDLQPGQVYYIESESGRAEYAAETRT